jgi:hypothetical protein
LLEKKDSRIELNNRIIELFRSIKLSYIKAKLLEIAK